MVFRVMFMEKETWYLDGEGNLVPFKPRRMQGGSLYPEETSPEEGVIAP